MSDAINKIKIGQKESKEKKERPGSTRHSVKASDYPLLFSSPIGLLTPPGAGTNNQAPFVREPLAETESDTWREKR